MHHKSIFIHTYMRQIGHIFLEIINAIFIVIYDRSYVSHNTTLSLAIMQRYLRVGRAVSDLNAKSIRLLVHERNRQVVADIETVAGGNETLRQRAGNGFSVEWLPRVHDERGVGSRRLVFVGVAT